jgi:hypothetical protein
MLAIIPQNTHITMYYSSMQHLSTITNNNPDIHVLRDSFNRVYHRPNRLQREYDLQKEAKQMGMLLEDYRQLYELRDEEEIDPYPQQKWWKKPKLWIGWLGGYRNPKS